MTNSEIIEGLKALRTIHNGNYAPYVDEAIKRLSAEPCEKIGCWEHGKELSREYIGPMIVNISYLDWHCSNCNCIIKQSAKPEWDYCPKCGSDMRESEEE